LTTVMMHQHASLGSQTNSSNCGRRKDLTVVRSEDRAWPHQTQLFAQLQVCHIRRLPMVYEHEINLHHFPLSMQPPQTGVTVADLDPHEIPQPRQIHQAPNDGPELRTTLEAPVLPPARLLQRGAKRDRAVPDIAAELDHDGRPDVADKVDDRAGLVGAHVHEVLLRAAVLVDGVEDGLRVVAQLGQVWPCVDVLEQGDLAAIVELPWG
jgi:hypothetical protein